MYISYFCSLASSLKWFLLFPLAALLMLLLCFWLNFRMPSRSLLQLLHTHTHTHIATIYIFQLSKQKFYALFRATVINFNYAPSEHPLDTFNTHAYAPLRFQQCYTSFGRICTALRCLAPELSRSLSLLLVVIVYFALWFNFVDTRVIDSLPWLNW